MNESSTYVGSNLNLRDRAGLVGMRLGIGRNSYKVAPGLYGVGNPVRSSPVFVSANYKMSFDVLRRALSGIDAWVLVLNTNGVNVWCAAGKKTFSTNEVIRMIEQVKLSTIISHKELILPQLSAPGVSAYDVQKRSGFKIIFGPVRANDIKSFLDNNKKASEQMRTVTFTLRERFVLTPVEMVSRTYTSFYVIAAILAISLVGHYFFGVRNAWSMATWGISSYFIGLISGTFLTPLFLPWLPWRSFSAKGALTGIVSAGVFCALLLRGQLSHPALAAVLLFAASVSSYTSLTFTGSTPFTSPTGVEKEMRAAIPLQLTAAILSLALWLIAVFAGGAQ